MAQHQKTASVTLRWRVSREAKGELDSIPQKKREAFRQSKGRKNPPVRRADLPGSFHLDIYSRGVRSRRALNLKTTYNTQVNDEVERLAKEAERKAQDDKWRASHGFDSKIAGRVPFVEFFRSLVSAEKPKAWQATLYLLEKFPLGGTAIEAIDKAWLENFQEYLLAVPTRGRGMLKQNSASTYYSKVKAALNIAVDRKLIPSIPRVKAIPAIDTERSYLTQNELQSLANAPCPDAETKRAFLFACYTGLRISDIAALKWKHVQNGRIAKRIQKTGRVQYLDLPAIAESLLANGNGKGSHDSEAEIFSLPHQRVIWDILQVWAKNAKLAKHISFHTARHSFAVMALSHTKDLYLVSSLMNHQSIRVTQQYAKIVAEREREAMMSLPEIELS
jgi:integrase/recombinase XerD